MKIGKAPKRFGGPSTKFDERSKADAKAKRAAERQAAKSVAAEGPLSVFLDDDRDCPPGWTLVETTEEMIAVISDPANTARIERLAFDWHLGDGRPNAEAAATWLAERFEEDSQYVPALEVVFFHSTNKDKALEMMRRIQRGIDRRNSRRFIMMDLCLPFEAEA